MCKKKSFFYVYSKRKYNIKRQFWRRYFQLISLIFINSLLQKNNEFFHYLLLSMLIGGTLPNLTRFNFVLIRSSNPPFPTVLIASETLGKLSTLGKTENVWRTEMTENMFWLKLMFDKEWQARRKKYTIIKCPDWNCQYIY